MISNEMTKMLNAQVNAEYWSAYLFLSMSLDAEVHGYRGISNWMYVQAREEQEHSRMIQKYMMAQDAHVHLLPIPEVPASWMTPLEAFRTTLAHQKNLSHRIADMVHYAQCERDYATYNFLAWFVNEQVEAENACNELVQQFEKASTTPCYFMQIDYELQKRR